MASLAQKEEELAEKSKQMYDIFGGRDVADIPKDEALQIKGRNDELSALTDEVTELRKLHAMKLAAHDALKGRTGGETRRPPHEPGEGTTEPKLKSIGEVLAESVEYKAFRDGSSKTAMVQLPETKTLITLSTINNLVTRDPGIRPSAQEERTVGDLMLQSTTDNNAVSYMTETTFTNSAAEVVEGGTKPESALGFTETTETIRKIATVLPMTKEAIDDVKGLQAYVEGRMMFMVRRREEAELLTGDGTAPNLRGIVNRSGIQTQAKGADSVPAAIYKAMTLIRANAFAEPDAYVTHPLDWQDIRLLTTADGIFIFGSPQDAGVDRIWGLPVRITTAMTQNTGLVGAFKPHSERVIREGLTMTMSTEHSTYFIENKVMLLVEERLGLKVYRASAFATVTGV